MEYIISRGNAWVDITGKKFNFLTILGYLGKGKWHCKCECGNYTEVKTAKLNNNHTKSCGCLAKTNALKHNAVETREYITWTNIKARCTNPNNKAYKNYGGRGITICENWLSSFEQFFEDMGECPIGFSIERQNNNLGYFKENCIWASPKTQALNRRTNFIIEYQNQKKPLKQWCEELDLKYKKTFTRIKQLKWSIEKAFSLK